MLASVASSLSAAGSVFSHAMNCAACSGCWLWVVTLVAEPPQLPSVGLPASQFGSAATFHLPLVLGALPSRTPGPQTELTQPTWPPSLSAAFQSGVYLGLLLTTP